MTGRLLLLLVLTVPLTASQAAGAQARLVSGAFDPGDLRVAVGDNVTWTNADDRPHTVTSSWDDGAAFNVLLRPGERFTTRFDRAGDFPVRCVPHAYRGDSGDFEGMTMTVHVGAEAADATPNTPSRAAPAPAGVALTALLVAGALARRARRSPP